MPIRQLLSILAPAERVRLVGVFVSMLGMGVAQLAGVGVVLPFIALLSNPQAVHDNAWLGWLYHALGFTGMRSFLIFIGCVLLFLLVASNIITAVTIWLMTRFAWRVQERVSLRLMDTYLHQPYTAFLDRNSADIGKNILIESQQLASGVLVPVLKVLAFGMTAAMIAGFLLWLRPLLATGVIGVFGGAYLLVYVLLRRVLVRAGQQRMAANSERFQAVAEAFGSIKEVRILNREECFLARYEPAAGRFAQSVIMSQVLGQIPRYIIEGLAFVIVMSAILYLLASGEGLLATLPLASAFIVGGYRLLPSLQNIYRGVAQWRFNQSVVDTLYEDLVASPPGRSEASSGRDSATRARQHNDRQRQPSPTANTPLTFRRTLELDNLRYTYPNAGAASIKGISMTIRCNSFVAFTGASGAGKTTLADIILGLLRPDAGSIRVDGVALSDQNLRCWQANLGYVPQEIYLTDSSIASNIAYGLPPERVDRQAVERAAKIANIDEFITQHLADGYDTKVGERGVRLSGGQRQRIGIARALYHDPAIIVLDEATSALDNETERRIVNELDAMRGNRTLIVIAHRLTTVQKCHEILVLQEGRVAARGSFDDVVRYNARFSQPADMSGDGSLI